MEARELQKLLNVKDDICIAEGWAGDTFNRVELFFHKGKLVYSECRSRDIVHKTSTQLLWEFMYTNKWFTRGVHPTLKEITERYWGELPKAMLLGFEADGVWGCTIYDYEEDSAWQKFKYAAIDWYRANLGRLFW